MDLNKLDDDMAEKMPYKPMFGNTTSDWEGNTICDVLHNFDEDIDGNEYMLKKLMKKSYLKGFFHGLSLAAIVILIEILILIYFKK